MLASQRLNPHPNLLIIQHLRPSYLLRSQTFVIPSRRCHVLVVLFVSFGMMMLVLLCLDGPPAGRGGSLWQGAVYVGSVSVNSPQRQDEWFEVFRSDAHPSVEQGLFSKN